MMFDPDELEWLLPILAAYLCAPIVITTIAGVVVSLRYREAGHEVAGVVGFLAGIITVVGMVAGFFFDLRNTGLVDQYTDQYGPLAFDLAYAACCAVGVGVAVFLVYLTGRIRNRLTRRPDSDT